jgi:hypothetical protein
MLKTKYDVLLERKYKLKYILKKVKDDVLAIKEDDNINASQENKFADLFPKDETQSTVQAPTDGT